VLQRHAPGFPHETALILNPRRAVAEGVVNEKDSCEDGRVFFEEDFYHSKVFEVVVIAGARDSFCSATRDNKCVR
jgi:hypothetical protein